MADVIPLQQHAADGALGRASAEGDERAHVDELVTGTLVQGSRETRADRNAWKRVRELAASALTSVLGRYGAQASWARRLDVRKQNITKWLRPHDSASPTLADVLLLEREDAAALFRLLLQQVEARPPAPTESLNELALRGGAEQGDVLAAAATLARGGKPTLEQLLELRRQAVEAREIDDRLIARIDLEVAAMEGGRR